MIALCLIRIAMFEAGRLKNLSVAQLSFARALTQTRLFLKLLMSAGDVGLWPSIWEEFVRCCARHRVHSKLGRQFPEETGSNIEQRVEGWKSDAGGESLNSKQHRRCHSSRKPVRI